MPELGAMRDIGVFASEFSSAQNYFLSHGSEMVSFPSVSGRLV